jgi:predicted dehydrogenase/type 1 glutamine amidotransferase
MSDASTGVLTLSIPDQLSQVEQFRVVVLRGDYGPLSSDQERALYDFVERGGGLVCLGDTAEAYREYTLLGEIIGPMRGFCAPRCEIIAQVADPDHYVTRRLDSSFAVHEAVFLLDEVPSDAHVIWKTNWHFRWQTLAFTRPFGQGRVFCTTLGSSPETQALPIFKQLTGRAIRYASGAATEERPARVAMIGYGAIGFEHGTAINNVPGLTYAVVCDRNEARLQQAIQAFPGVSTRVDHNEIAGDPAIDLVFVSTPPDTHAAIALQMLRAGKHVVVEKPFSLTVAEADAMIQLAQEQQRVLTVYQSRRWDPDYLAIKQELERGTIGPVFHLETFIGGYQHPCDYWHSHEPVSGGVFYDWGSHYLDWILNLIPEPVVDVRGIEHKRVWYDVTNADQASVSLRFAGGQEALFIHSDIAAAPKPKWYILGERGAIVGRWRQEYVKSRRWSGDLIEERLALAEALPDVYVYTRESGDRVHEQHLTLPPAPAYAFHRNLANHLHNGEPLAVRPEEARRNIMVMEAAKRSVSRSGEVIVLEQAF